MSELGIYERRARLDGGWCSLCREFVRVGDIIMKTTTGRWGHKDCVKKDNARRFPEPQRVPVLLADGRIDWDKLVELSRTRQEWR